LVLLELYSSQKLGYTAYLGVPSRLYNLVTVLEDERSASEFQGQHVKIPELLDHLMDNLLVVGGQVLVPEHERFVEFVLRVL
jgi:hypothetical protein